MSEQAAKSGVQLTAVPPTRVWERQPNESPEAFEAFQVYLSARNESGAGIREVARRLGKSATLISRWSSKWNWVERYRAYENNQVLLLEREQQTALRKESEKWATRRIETREKGFELGSMLIERAKGLLGLPVFNKRVEGKVKAKSGEEIETVTILEFQQHPRDARLMAETGIRLLRLSADMSTDNIAIPTDVDFENLSDEELDAYVDNMLKMRNEALGGTEKK